jgi:hypothetical protein
MISTLELFRQGRKEEIWSRHWGFLDLSMEEFMEIQNRLLLEQIDLVYDSKIGQAIMGKRKPQSVNEFRDQVPLTTYKDYAPFLSERKTDALSFQPHVWARTSGRSDYSGIKWLPYTKEMYSRFGEQTVGGMILSAASFKGDIQIEEGDIFLLATAPPPYSSGINSRSLQETFPVRFLPTLDKGEQMDFSKRLETGFNSALDVGLDYFYGLSSVLAKMGEHFENGTNERKFSPQMLKPGAISRMFKAVTKAKFAKRGLLPKDIWKLKGVMAGGTDAKIYQERIEHYWGKKPLEGYACTEGLAIATQTMNYKDMTFFPDIDFLEFIPKDEHFKSKQIPGYQPKTLLLDELKPGVYELVFTNFRGGVLLRYRVGDLFEVVSLKDEEQNINLPQVRFYSRADDIIDIGGLMVFTESLIWQAIEAANINYEDWVARKEFHNNEQVVHLYIEPKIGQPIKEGELKEQVINGFEQVCPEYVDMQSIVRYKSIAVSLLQPGSFANYMDYQRQAGADMAHIKPPHMQPTELSMKHLAGGMK